jgi:DNA-binding transcriptional LysR family regulator
MDKLRAIQYFNRAVESGSFAAAARSFDVSTPAVTHLVGSLERALGVLLFNRTTRGLSLTADGQRYYESSRKIEADLYDLEQRLGQRDAKPRGTLKVGIRHFVGQNCLVHRIPRFLARFPDIELVITPVVTIQDIEKENLDIVVLVGWPPKRDLVVRHLAQVSFIVCASPEYCMRAGRPERPEDLRDHHCLMTRNVEGVLMDRWSFEKGGERRTIDVNGRLLSDDRLWLEEAACAGGGVIRLIDLTVGRYLSAGLLVPVLNDWIALEAPTIYAAYPPRQRRSKLVRVFLDFLIEVFAQLDQERTIASGSLPRVTKPLWWDRAQGRHSAYVAREKK